VLGVPCGLHDDFFELGGSSLLCGRLAASIRRKCGVPLAAAAVFSCRTVAALAAEVDRRAPHPDSPVPDKEAAAASKQQEWMPPARPQDSPLPLLVQALPFFVLHPLRRALGWLLFLYVWVSLPRAVPMGRGAAFLAALVIARCAAAVVLPLAGIAGKWAIVGRHAAGRYPLWGGRYLRWWFVDQLLAACGRGAFDLSAATLAWYHRLLGARIGRGATIDRRVHIADHDLVDIGAGALVDSGPVRAFRFEHGAMALTPVRVGDGAAVCFKSILAPGTDLPPGACLAPLSSTRAPPASTDAAGDRALCSVGFPAPAARLQFAGHAIAGAVWAASQLPAALILVLTSLMARDLATYADALDWFVAPQRIALFAALRVCRAAVCPLMRVACCIAVKQGVVGRFEAGPRERGEWELFRHWLMRELLPSEKLQVR
jgi:non-ribosomal peptide synthetase-like protein